MGIGGGGPGAAARSAITGAAYPPPDARGRPCPVRPIEDTFALITGATDGLGRGLARELHARRAHVLLHGRDRERLGALARELATDGEPAPTFLADLASLDDVRAMADAIERSVPQL